MRFLSIFLIVLFLPTGVAAKPNLKKASREACSCLKGTYKETTSLGRQVLTAQKKGDTEQMAALQDDLLAVAGKVTGCFEALEEKFPEIAVDPELMQELLNLTQERCPPPEIR